VDKVVEMVVPVLAGLVAFVKGAGTVAQGLTAVLVLWEKLKTLGLWDKIRSIISKDTPKGDKK